MIIKSSHFSIIVIGIILASLLMTISSPVIAETLPGSNPIPVLAYYYIWYSNNSWDRAKTDFPLLGRYSSDDRSVMLQHILWAKDAGITGFIVSWKNTDTLNKRLEQLVALAEQENFKLVALYQGLDFQRNPLPVEDIANGLDYFIQNFAGSPAFQLFSKPAVIWSGTWMFSTQDIAQVTSTRRSSLLILSSERNLDGYSRLANIVDGDAYYWSSVNADTNPGYVNKLIEMGVSVHQHGGLWIPSAAPGFDARLIGGKTVIDRKDGATLRTQYNNAMSSTPDALGIISWNEFSENSHIEPSLNFGKKYLEILSSITHSKTPIPVEFDSSIPFGNFSEIPWSRSIAISGLVSIMVASLLMILRRKGPG
jgi:hypothetical protein